MKRLGIGILLLAAALAVGACETSAEAGLFGRRVVGDVWHQGIYDPAWAGGHRLVVPPPGGMRHVEYRTGVGGTSVYRIRH